MAPNNAVFLFQSDCDFVFLFLHTRLFSFICCCYWILFAIQFLKHFCIVFGFCQRVWEMGLYSKVPTYMYVLFSPFCNASIFLCSIHFLNVVYVQPHATVSSCYILFPAVHLSHYPCLSFPLFSYINKLNTVKIEFDSSQQHSCVNMMLFLKFCPIKW